MMEMIRRENRQTENESLLNKEWRSHLEIWITVAEPVGVSIAATCWHDGSIFCTHLSLLTSSTIG